MLLAVALGGAAVHLRSRRRRLLAAALLLAGAQLQEPTRTLAAPPGTATARYYPHTGTLEFDVGAGLGVVGIESIGNIITGLMFSPHPQKYSSNVIGYFNPAGLTPGIIRFENGFVTGLTPSDFVFGYVPVGQGEVAADVIVPEPCGLALAAVASAGTFGAARRRWPRRHKRSAELLLSTAATPESEPT
jgi:hypothetical protein